MDARFFDVLHDTGNDDVGPVADRIDIDFDRVFEKFVDQDRLTLSNDKRFGNKLFELRRVVADFHRPTAKHKARPHEERKADARGDDPGFFQVARDAVLRLLQAQSLEEKLEALAVLSDVDGLRTRAQDGDARAVQRLAELERRLPAILHDAAKKLAAFLFAPDEGDHVLGSLRPTNVTGAGTALSVAFPAPGSVRPSIQADELAQSMDKTGEPHVIVSTLDGVLIGIVERDDLHVDR